MPGRIIIMFLCHPKSQVALILPLPMIGSMFTSLISMDAPSICRVRSWLADVRQPMLHLPCVGHPTTTMNGPRKATLVGHLQICCRFFACSKTMQIFIANGTVLLGLCQSDATNAKN